MIVTYNRGFVLVTLKDCALVWLVKVNFLSNSLLLLCSTHTTMAGKKYVFQTNSNQIRNQQFDDNNNRQIIKYSKYVWCFSIVGSVVSPLPR